MWSAGVAVGLGQLPLSWAFAPQWTHVPSAMIAATACGSALTLAQLMRSTTAESLPARLTEGTDDLAPAAVVSNAERFRVIIENSHDAVILLDRNRIITYCNARASELMNQPVDQLIGSTLEAGVTCTEPGRVQDAFDVATDIPGQPQLVDWAIRIKRAPKRRFESVIHYLPNEPLINGFVMTSRDVTSNRKLQEELEHQAFRDPLTGLPNRALFKDRLSHALHQADRNGSPLSVLYCDLDGFKGVNDSLGHALGDVLLLIATDRLTSTLRAGDTLGRLGGDEFAVLLENTPPEQVQEVAERIVQVMNEPFDLMGSQEAVVGVSLGIVDVSGGNGQTVDDVLRHADLAMYMAKANGKGRHVRFEPFMHDHAAREMRLKNDLRHAIAEGNELTVHYQPIYELSTRKPTSVEALVRWNHPELGMIPPLDFIPMAEDTGMIVPLGELVLRTACEQMAAWQQESPETCPESLSVNFSTRQLQEPNIINRVATILNESGMCPTALTVEVTESALVSDMDVVRSCLEGLRDLGIKIAIDDFGTGYSSLGYLHKFPVDVLKLDRAFVTGLAASGHDSTLINAILEMGRMLGVCTVAEGIELPEELYALQKLGCTMGQGFLFARPADAINTEKEFSSGPKNKELDLVVEHQND